MMEKEDYSLSVRCGCGASFAVSGAYLLAVLGSVDVSKTVTEHLEICPWFSPVRVMVPAVTP